MAQLGIPMQALLDAYAEDGLSTPPLTYDDPRSSVQAPVNKAAIEQIGQEMFTEQDEQRRAEQTRREWELMFLHTRRVMADLGMPASTVEAMLGELQQRRLGTPTPAQRRRAEELHGDDVTTTNADASDEDTTGRRPHHGASSTPRPR